jgi:sortase B
VKEMRKPLMLVLALILAFSAFQLVRGGLDYRQGDQDYAEAEALAGLEALPGLPDPTPVPTAPAAEGEAAAPGEPPAVYADPYAEALKNMDFAALREVNPEVLGWILIPGTRISYPLVQGADDEYYLNHTWRGSRSAVGAIFVEAQNSADLSDFHTIIYGHRMNNGSMFHSLASYQDLSYWQAYPYVYITDDSGSRKYEIFAAYEAGVTTPTYRLGFSTQIGKESFLEHCTTSSVIETGVVPTVYDRILTLSTCTGNGHATRWVVQAVCRGERPAEETPAPVETPAPAEELSQGETGMAAGEEPAAADPADRPEVQNSEVPQSEPVVQPTEAPQPTQDAPPPPQETEALPTASGDAAPEEPLLPPEAVTGERE